MAKVLSGYSGDPSSLPAFAHFLEVLGHIWDGPSEMEGMQGFAYNGLYVAAHFYACAELDAALAGGKCAQDAALGRHFAAACEREPPDRRPCGWFFPNVPPVLLRMLRLDPASTRNFETEQQKAFLELFDPGVGMPAFERDIVLERFGYSGRGAAGMARLKDCPHRWALAYAQRLCVPFASVRGALAKLRAVELATDSISEGGVAMHLMLLAHVQMQNSYVDRLVEQGADKDTGVLHMIRIGANDPRVGMSLERVHDQLKLSADGSRLVPASSKQSDSDMMRFWSDNGATELHLRYLSAAPTGLKWHFSCESASGRCVPALNVRTASLNVTGVGQGTGKW